jgi:hypothetical protein
MCFLHINQTKVYILFYRSLKILKYMIYQGCFFWPNLKGPYNRFWQFGPKMAEISSSGPERAHASESQMLTRNIYLIFFKVVNSMQILTNMANGYFKIIYNTFTFYFMFKIYIFTKNVNKLLKFP